MKTKPPSVAGPCAGVAAPSQLVASCSTKDKRPQQQHHHHHNADKESSHGKFAGIGPESVRCISEQISFENLSEDVCSALAEDLSYKLRQLIHNVALRASHTKSPRVEVEDVNATLRLMDSQPVLGPSNPQWMPIPETEHCFTVDPKVDLVELATRSQTFYSVPPPSLSVSWVTDSKSSSSSSSNKSTSSSNSSSSTVLSSNLHNYYMKISKALLSSDKKLVAVAKQDLSTNTHIGPVIPNIINLAVLVLNETPTTHDTYMIPISHEFLHRRALTILDCLFVNPCCSDTNITAQLHRLFPVLISNVLTGSILSDQFLRIITSVVKVWPQFAYIGRTTVLEYLSQGVEERLTGTLVECLTALGRKALVDGLTHKMSLMDTMIYDKSSPLYRLGLHEALLNASHTFLNLPLSKYEPKIAYIDGWLYEILADAILPRRINRSLPVKCEKPPSSPKVDLDSPAFSPPQPASKKSKVRLIRHFPRHQRDVQFYDNVFDYSKFKRDPFPDRIRFNVAGCRQLQVRQRQKCDLVQSTSYANTFHNGGRYNLDKKMSVIVSNGALLRFKYKLPGDERKTFPSYHLYTL